MRTRSSVAVDCQRDVDAAAARQARDAVQHGVLQQRLQHQARQRQRPRQWLLARPAHLQAFAQAQGFDREVTLGQFHFLAQAGIGFAGAERGAEQVGQVEHRAFGDDRIAAHEAGDGVHAVEEEMRLDPRLQRIGLGARAGAHLRLPAVDREQVAQHDAVISAAIAALPLANCATPTFAGIRP